MERREGIARQLQAHGLEFEFVEAIRGSALTPQERERCVDDVVKIQQHLGRSLTDSEIGCALSHLRVYEIMRHRGIDQALVLEDDARLLPEFGAMVAALTPLSVDIMLLGYPKLSNDEIAWARWFDPIKVIDCLSSGHRYGVSPRKGHLGMVGYVLSGHAAQELRELNWPVYTVADDHPYFSTRLKIGHLRPYAVTEDMSHESTIRGGFRKNRHGLSAKQFLGRLLKGLIRRLNLIGRS